jgi:hypothetical protein
VTLFPGATSVDDCTVGEAGTHYLGSIGVAVLCPEGVSCRTAGVTVETLQLDVDRFRTSNRSTKIWRCKLGYCTPSAAEQGGEFSSERRRLDATQFKYCTPHHMYVSFCLDFIVAFLMRFDVFLRFARRQFLWSFQRNALLYLYVVVYLLVVSLPKAHTLVKELPPVFLVLH